MRLFAPPGYKEKKNGSLHEVEPIAMAAILLREIQGLHDLDTADVDDVLRVASCQWGEWQRCCP